MAGSGLFCLDTLLESTAVSVPPSVELGEGDSVVEEGRTCSSA